MQTYIVAYPRTIIINPAFGTPGTCRSDYTEFEAPDDATAKKIFEEQYLEERSGCRLFKQITP
jgi:hypothetical protein